MDNAEKPFQNNPPCSVQDKSICEDCELDRDLKCRFSWPNFLLFSLFSALFFLPLAVGLIWHGMTGWFLGWLGVFMAAFITLGFKTFCRHCPLYADKGLFLKCYAMVGIPKLWASSPKPVQKNDLKLLAAVFLPIGAIPFVLLAVSGAYGFFVLSILGFACMLIGMRAFFCPQCVHFSCPLNSVPQEKVLAYLQRNPEMQQALRDSGK
ncbi:hypothetical protein GF373_11355 [bacterium]|nr:hypothetical protein [bacterium]